MNLRSRKKKNKGILINQTKPGDDFFTNRMRKLNEKDVLNIKRRLKQKAGDEKSSVQESNKNLLVKPSFVRLEKLPKDFSLNKTVNLQSASSDEVPFNFKDHNDGLPEMARATLREIYYNPRHVAGFSSPRKLYLAIKNKIPYISQQQVRRWLASQRTYGLTKSVNKNFKRRKVIVRGLAHQYQADLLDMAQKSERKLKFGPNRKVEVEDDDDNEKDKRLAVEGQQQSDFVLTVIDCFSRFAQAIPIPSKKGKDVAEAFKHIFSEKLMKVPKKMQTDDGVEFYNQDVRKVFRNLDIIHFSTDQELKAQIVERFNRTLREKINRYRTANNTMQYHDVLPDLIHAYNSSPHSSLGNYAPAEVKTHNEDLIREIQYGPYLREEPPKPRFKIGEVVRAVRIKKGLKKMPTTFKRELFVVADVIYTNPPTYRLKSRETGDSVAGSYYGAQLQKVLLTKRS